MKILKIIITLFVIFIVIPVAVIASLFGLTIKNDKAPYTNETYQYFKNFKINNYFEDELVNMIKDPNNKLEATFSQETLNAVVSNLLVKAIEKSNKNYNPEDSKNDYILEEPFNNLKLKLKTIFFTFEQSSIAINASVRVENVPVIKTYNTTLRMTFDFKSIVENNHNKIKVALSKIKLGNLPLIKPIYSKILDKLIEKFFTEKKNFKAEIEKQFKASPEFESSAVVNPDEYSITVNITKYILDLSKTLIKDLNIKNFFENTLLSLKGKNLSILNIVDKKRLGFSFDLNNLVFKVGDVLKPKKEKILTDDEIKNMIGKQLLLLSLSNTKYSYGKTSIYYTMDEESINQIITSKFKQLEAENKTNYTFKVGDNVDFKFSVNNPYLQFLNPDENQNAKAKFYISYELTSSKSQDDDKYLVYNEILTTPEVIQYDMKPSLAFRLDEVSFLNVFTNETIDKNKLSVEQRHSLFEFLINFVGGNFIKHNDRYYFVLDKLQEEAGKVIKPKEVFTKDKILTIETQIVDEKISDIVEKISLNDEKKKEFVDKIVEQFTDVDDEVKEAIKEVADTIKNKEDIENLDTLLEKYKLKEEFSEKTYKEIIDYTTANLPEYVDTVKTLLNSYGIGIK